MKEYIPYLIQGVVALLIGVFSSFITNISSKKLNFKQLVKANYNLRKREVFENFISLHNTIYLITYNKIPFDLIDAINTVMLYLNTKQHTCFIELKNMLDSASEKDIPKIIDKFNSCIAILQKEIKKLRKEK